MIEAFITAFVIYFVVIDPVSNAPIYLAVTQHQDRARKLRIALKGTAIMVFFALCGAWILGYLDVSEAAFRIAGGIKTKLPTCARRTSSACAAPISAKGLLPARSGLISTAST